MDDEREALCGELELVDTDLGFLLLLVTAVMLSFWSTARQRDALCLTLQGDRSRAAQVGDVARVRLGTAALVTGSLGFCFMQALERCQTVDPADVTQCRSARLNLIAGFLVLLASLIRLLDLNMVRYAQPALDDTLPPS